MGSKVVRDPFCRSIVDDRTPRTHFFDSGIPAVERLGRPCCCADCVTFDACVCDIVPAGPGRQVLHSNCCLKRRHTGSPLSRCAHGQWRGVDVNWLVTSPGQSEGIHLDVNIGPPARCCNQILPAAPADKSHQITFCAPRNSRAPNLNTGAHVICPNLGIVTVIPCVGCCPSHKHQPTSSRQRPRVIEHASVGTRVTVNLSLAKRSAPCNLASVAIDRHHLSPRWLDAGHAVRIEPLAESLLCPITACRWAP